MGYFHRTKRPRECKAGAGQEQTKNQCDTPGFKLRTVPEITTDNRHSTKLCMERNHLRVVQTAEDVLQSWRGNCDVQILIYNSGYCNNSIDTTDIARVTDYVVAYSCKGNKSLKEERKQNKDIILRLVKFTSDDNSQNIYIHYLNHSYTAPIK